MNSVAPPPLRSAYAHHKAPPPSDTRFEHPVSFEGLDEAAPMRVGALPTGGPVFGAALDARIESRARTVVNPWLKPSLERGAIPLADRSLGGPYDARVIIPLSALETEPMTPTEVIDHIKTIELPMTGRAFTIVPSHSR